MITIDEIDRRILSQLQKTADIGLEALGEKVGLSRNACWRRIRALDDAGVIKSRVAILDADQLDLGLTVFIAVKTDHHDPDWLANFARTSREIPEILGAYRMTGDMDYLIRARVSNVAAYDRLYQRIIQKIELADVSASFVMEEIKDTTALPL
ncbi:MAG: Lrp/AsnC family transcriptional regulator [Marinosulfonomonas sp.]|nr:Lrp/AsnC family transcriptional regulator [Marinosulfonomonas sp.]